MLKADAVAQLLRATEEHGAAQSSLSTSQVAYSNTYATAYIDLVSAGESATSADRLARIRARQHQQMIDVSRGDVARTALEQATYSVILSTLSNSS